MKWGEAAQIDMLFEEMAELTKAICKHRRGTGGIIPIIEEAADVAIMLEQLIALLKTEDVDSIQGFDIEQQEKLRRLEAVLEEKND